MHYSVILLLHLAGTICCVYLTDMYCAAFQESTLHVNEIKAQSGEFVSLNHIASIFVLQ